MTFLACTFISLYYPALRTKWATSNKTPLPSLSSFHPRQLLLSAGTAIWAARLGSFLFARIIKTGSDSRFDKVKTEPGKFLFFWFMQATWVSLTALPVFIANSIPKSAHPPLGWRDAIGVGVWASGMLLEATADRQKNLWRKAKEDKKHSEKFISSGVWKYSRHPNYFGECTLWTGSYLTALPSLLAASGTMLPGWTAAACLVSPAFVTLLITKLSGVPPLEASAKKKYGKEYQEYARKTSIFVPWFPKE